MSPVLSAPSVHSRRADPAGPPTCTAYFTPRRERCVRDFAYIGYETIDDGRIAAITLDRPKQRNAQTRGMLVELGAAFELAEAGDPVRVVILRAAGAAFSAGHDLGSADDVRERSPGPGQHPTYQCNGGTFGGVE